MPIDKYASTPKAGVRHTRPSGLEQLEYMADLLSEMKDIALGEGCDTLAGLLNLSQTEARRQARNFRR